jgi:L-amino acid N-acyltransferase YncA
LSDIQLRPVTPTDLDALWEIFHAHVAAGETYPFDTDTPRRVCDAYWLGEGIASFVAVDGTGRVLGMYKLVANQAGRGSHVANASYMVSPAAQGMGVGRLLGEHSIVQARHLRYLAMQFNYVVSTNTAAVALWQKLGFAIVGTLPQAYRHARLGLVDAYVMFRKIEQ